MKNADVVIGRTYRANVSGNRTLVRVDRLATGSRGPIGGWFGTNLVTGKEVRIKTGQRLTEVTQNPDLIQRLLNAYRGDVQL